MGSFLEDMVKNYVTDNPTDNTHQKEFDKRLVTAYELGKALANFLQSEEKDEYMESKSHIQKELNAFGRGVSILFGNVEVDRIPKFFLDMYKENFTGFHQRTTLSNIETQLMGIEFDKGVKETLNMDEFGINIRHVLVQFNKNLSNPDIFSISVELYDYDSLVTINN